MIPLRLSVLVGFLLLSASPSQAQTVYGVAYNGPGGLASLYSINPTNGAATIIGNTGYYRVGGIAFSPSGTLYGIGRDSGNYYLLTINTTTGAATPVGATGVDGAITDLSFRGDGTLFVTAFNTTYTANLSTGAYTLIGNASAGGTADGSVFSAGGTLYIVDSSDPGTTINVINQTNGASTFSMNASYTGFGGTSELRVNAIDYDPVGGNYYASVTNGSSFYVGQIDLGTGVITALGPTVSGLDAIAVAPTVIPEPSTCATIFGAAVVGLAVMRRRLRAT